MIFKILFALSIVASGISCKKESKEILLVQEENTNNVNDTSATDTNTLPSKVKYLALGDSYTVGASVGENDRYPNQLLKRLDSSGVETESFSLIAQSGWTTLNLKTAIEAAYLPDDFNLVSLLIGVNNQYQGKSSAEYINEFEELLLMAIGFAGGNKSRVFVLSIPDYGYTTFGKSNQAEISKELDEFNAINDSICKVYNIKYYNITPISRQGLNQPNLVASDGLHPSGIMYSLWVDEFFQDIRKLFK